MAHPKLTTHVSTLVPTALPAGKKTSKQRKSRSPGVEVQLKLPNERDESIDMTHQMPDPMIKQASADVKQGLQDTSKSAEMNHAYKKLKSSIS